MVRTEPMKVLFVGAYPPSSLPCASHTQNTVRNLALGGRVMPKVYAASSQLRDDYCNDVVDQFKQDSRFAHIGAAERMNETGADLLVVEHDLGTFGGQHGEYLLDLLERVDIPFIMNCHRAPAAPLAQQREVLSDACYYSSAVVVPGQYAADALTDLYEVAADKVRIVPNGVPQTPTETRRALKMAAGFAGQFVVSSYGYLSPGKGLEFGIQAVAEVSRTHPDIVYLVVGETHPSVKSEGGEAYRSSLMALAASLGVACQVRFADRSSDTKDLLNCLAMSDAYMTPYICEDQGVSHTLGCAVGRGRVVVSTPFPYAQEMLGEGRGLLARFGDARSLANCLTSLIESPGMRRQMEQNCLRLSEGLTWPRVVHQYEDVLTQAHQENSHNVTM